ncbi:MAG: hypothetical protein GY750_00930 [Lentisphaerae bacterium]|nr:hypothetical protein [Lentisphaerota bacterium]
MSLLKEKIISDYSKLEKDREIYSEYECKCNKAWQQKDQFIIYSAYKKQLKKIYHSDNENIDENIEKAISLIGHKLTNKPIVSGGHTVLNLNDRFHTSNEVLSSVDASFKFIEGIQNNHNKKAEFLVLLNDFYMEKDAGTDLGNENQYRKKALKPYIIPLKINEYLQDYSKKLNRIFDLHYCSEKNMADRFKRHIQNRKKNSSIFHTIDNSNWEIIINDRHIPIMVDNKPNCPAGNAATYRAIRYNVTSNKMKDNFTSYVGLFPLCSMQNVLDGYLIADKFYETFDLPTHFIFFGKSCF